MTKLYKRLISGVSLLMLCPILFAQIPEGGIQLNATTGTTFQRIGSGALTQIEITDQPFTTGLRMTVGPNVNNSWDSQIKFPAVDGIETNDVVLVSFWARTESSVNETGEGNLIVVVEHNTTYAKELFLSVSIGQEWTQYYASVKSTVSLLTSQVNYAFFMGYPSQVIEVADVKFLNYKQTVSLDDLPVNQITYIGQDPDAPWREPAQQRINRVRKGAADIIVYNENGEVAENAEVSIEMVRHQFGFGSAIPVNQFMTNTTFRETVYELFNEVVFENDLKWGSFNPFSTVNLSRAIDSLDKYKIPLRGHNIIWPAWRWMPSTMRQYENNPAELRMQIEKHIDDKSQFTAGRLNDWDVINEPYTENEIMKILGNEVMADWFKRVRQNDRGVKLYLNDYSIISGGGINTAKHDFYYNLVKYIDDLGGGVDGIGIQGHFGSDLTPISRIYDIIDRFAELGKDIKITEHDIDIVQRETQAEYTRDFMTILFSHESVKSILWWGFWENSHWRPDGAFFNADWSIRPHGEMYKQMVFDEWWTSKIDTTTNDQGQISLEGFLGTYQYTVKSGEKERTGTFTLDHSFQSNVKNNIHISLDEEVPVQVSISSSKPGILCDGETIELSAPAGTGLTYKWYNGDAILPNDTQTIETGEEGLYTVMVSKGSVEMTSLPFEVIVNPYPDAIITAGGDLSFCPGGSVPLSANTSLDLTYTWLRNNTKIHGSVTSIDVTTAGTYTLVTNSKGCATTSEPVTVEVYDVTHPDCETSIHEIMNGFKVYPNPFEGSFILETSHISRNEITVELFDAMGKMVYSTLVQPSSVNTIIPADKPGFYTLRVSGVDGTKVFKLIGRTNQ